MATTRRRGTVTGHALAGRVRPPLLLTPAGDPEAARRAATGGRGRWPPSPKRRRTSSTAWLASSQPRSRARSSRVSCCAAARPAGHADPEEPHARRDVELVEERARRVGDGGPGRPPVGRGDRAGQRGEVAVAELEGDRRPARPWARSRDATASAWRTSSPCSSSRSVRSWANVSSWPIDLSARSGSTARSSMPLARSCRCWPWRRAERPHQRAERQVGQVADGGHAEALAGGPGWPGPTPQSACDRERLEEAPAPRRARTRPRPGPARRPARSPPAWPPPRPAWPGTSWAPRRRAREAQLGVDTSRRSAAATVAPGPNSRRAPVTSRNASSREIGSTSGV